MELGMSTSAEMDCSPIKVRRTALEAVGKGREIEPMRILDWESCKKDCENHHPCSPIGQENHKIAASHRDYASPVALSANSILEIMANSAR
ncbi:MAG: hypothetical protein ACJAT6_001328 [Akkermansiaceae bacterium]|jgi:hypothetical protein